MYEQDAQALGFLQRREVEIHGFVYMSIANLLWICLLCVPDQRCPSSRQHVLRGRT